MRNAYRSEVWNAIVILARLRTSEEEAAADRKHADKLVDDVILAARKVIDRDHA